MKKSRSKDADLREEYDFRGGVRGKHHADFAKGTNLVALDPDVAAVFPDSESVNDALRAMAQIIESHRRQPSRKRAQAGEKV